MEEKIKVNITKEIHENLLKDMELFEFYKGRNELNKNLFYNTLIVNYYQTYLENEKKIIGFLDKTISRYADLAKDALESLTSDISDWMNRLKFLPNKSKLEVTISIKPTKFSQKAFNYISEYLLAHSSLSNYFRMLFASYISLPRNQREKIIFKQEHDAIVEAVKRRKKIFFSTVADQKSNHESSPYAIVSSKEEMFNYLLAVHKGKAYTFRLSRIRNITLLKEDLEITDEQKAIFAKMTKYGPQYSYDQEDHQEIIIRLTSKGMLKYRSIYTHRPLPYKIEDDRYYFDCSQEQVMQYFRRLGPEAIVLSPESLRRKMRDFYQKAYNGYMKVKEEKAEV